MRWMLPFLLVAGVASGQDSVGINAHIPADDELDALADLGVQWMRIDANWLQAEPRDGEYDWRHIDRVVNGADARGIRVFMTLAYAPQWASEGDGDGVHSNDVPRPGLYERFVEAAVLRYRDRVTHYGIWNEPNLSHFFRGSVEDYLDQVLIPGADAVHAACSDCLVVGPDLAHLRSSDAWNGESGICAFGECIFNGWEVSLAEILDGSGGRIDVVAHHIYTDSAQDMLVELVDGQSVAGVQYESGVKEITDAHAPGTPVWITEFGWETLPGGEWSEAAAAGEIEAAYAGLVALQSGTQTGAVNQPWPELEKFFWYDLQDDPNTYDWGVFTWGLLDTEGQRKETWEGMAAAVATYGGCEAVEEEPGDDTGDPTEEDTDEPGDDEEQDSGDEDEEPTDTGSEGAQHQDTTPPGCGCAAAPGAASFAWLGLLALARRRRRRSE